MICQIAVNACLFLLNYLIVISSIDPPYILLVELNLRVKYNLPRPEKAVAERVKAMGRCLSGLGLPATKPAGQCSGWEGWWGGIVNKKVVYTIAV